MYLIHINPKLSFMHGQLPHILKPVQEFQHNLLLQRQSGKKNYRMTTEQLNN